MWAHWALGSETEYCIQHEVSWISRCIESTWWIHLVNHTFVVGVRFSVYSLSIHCIFTAYTQPIQCLCPTYSQPIHSHIYKRTMSLHSDALTVQIPYLLVTTLTHCTHPLYSLSSLTVLTHCIHWSDETGQKRSLSAHPHNQQYSPSTLIHCWANLCSLTLLTQS